MKSLKFFKILSVTLLILNIATLSFFYFNRPPGPPRPGEARLAEEIGLTGDDKKQVDKLEIAHHKQKRALIQKNFRLQKKLYQSLENDLSSNEIMQQIHETRAETDRMTYEFFSEVATYCNKKQRKKLDEMIDKGLRQITQLPGRKP
ncbi:MAG: hypothetical protein NXI10_06395 [bacterium]|nr:hypothetical protein [bacterium]